MATTAAVGLVFRLVSDAAGTIFPGSAGVPTNGPGNRRLYPIPPGDFDKDLNIDGNDLTKWEMSYGVDDGADANGDGISDGQDFLIWQQNAGTMAPLSATSAAVPEPTTSALALAALCLVIGRRRST